MVAEHGLSVRQACRAARLARSAFYAPRRPRDDGPIIAAIERYVRDNPRPRLRQALSGGARPGLRQVPAVSCLPSAAAEYQAPR